MQLRFLLHDHEEVTHRDVVWEFADQETLRQLKNVIASEWHISPQMQNIFFADGHNANDFNLDYSLTQIGLHNMDIVIVKHNELQNWAACLLSADSIAQKKADHLKAKYAKQASKLLNNLEESNFFIIYPSFFDKFINLSTLFDRYVIGVEENIKIAVGTYFKKYFANEALSITFSPKPDTGAQEGFLAHVADADYFIKNHSFLGRGSAHSRVDKRELFVYRLLQFIGVGADVHFVPSAYSRCYTSALVFHIATKRVQGFVKRALRSACSFTEEHQMLLDLIRKLLYLGDLNSGNYGLDDKHQLIIIDFAVLPQESIHNASLCGQRLDHPSLKRTIQNWELLKNFTKAKESIANDCKRMGSINWREGYDEYLKVVLENIELLNNML